MFTAKLSEDPPSLAPHLLSFLDENCTRPIVTVVNLVRTARLLEKDLNDFMGVYGLTGPQCEVLFLLRCHGGERGLTLTELGEWQGVTKANMTGLVDRLERDGLVTRAKHPDDRRLTMVRATPKAIDCLAGLEQPHEEHMGRVLSCLNPEEQETLIQLLTRLRQSLGD